MKFAIGCLVVLVVLALIVGGWFIAVRNNLVTQDQGVQAQWAQVENQYQRRYDLIPNLVRTVQGAANFEKSTLEAVIGARSRVGQVTMNPSGAPGTPSNTPNDPQAMANFEAAQGALTNALSRLLVVVERYPDLKSNQNFLELQSQLEGTENRIAVERRRYNEVAQQYNASVLKFPANIVANMSGFKPKAYFRGVEGSNVAPEVNFQPFGNPAPAPAPAPATATTGTR
ncbi:MAG TPA: LemA family protein [Thermoanaerobaculia bacterium]|nr:LemA family protein [Thermoanaerobaculia bacterium]